MHVRNFIGRRSGSEIFVPALRDSAGRGKFRAAHSQSQLARRIKEDGYLAITQKVGRPCKWMKGEAGVERDIEAVAAVREAVGSNFNLMVDANNGYRDNFDGAVRYLEECDPYELYWIEEIFPEEIGPILRPAEAVAYR